MPNFIESISFLLKIGVDNKIFLEKSLLNSNELINRKLPKSFYYISINSQELSSKLSYKKSLYMSIS